MTRPNIIFILCDQMRGDAIGADGNPHVLTPAMDYLASRGSMFKHAYSACPSCIPARATLWTGQSQWHTGVLGMGRGQGGIPRDFANTLSSLLTKAGYRTHMIGKGHFHMHPDREHMGFESMELEEASRPITHGVLDEYREWFEDNAPTGVTPDDHGIGSNDWMARPWHTQEHLHPSYWTISRSIEFLKSVEEKPFFLNVSFNRPHSPYTPPAFLFDYLLAQDLPEPTVGDWAEMHDDPNEARKPSAWRGKLPPAMIKRAKAGYWGEVSFVDLQINRLMIWMQRACPQILRNTWFIISSDHGDMQGDHNLWRKTYAYEGSARVPFIVAPPPSNPVPRRQQVDEVVELRDIMPTILNIAGEPIPKDVDGASVLRLMNEKDAHWRTYIHGEHCQCYSEEQEMQFVTDGLRKFIWLPRIGREQFFDLESDPGETRDLIAAPDYADDVLKWRAYLIAELNERNCDWVRDGKLHCPANEPLVSPFMRVRWQGT